MTLALESLVIFKGDSGLSLTVAFDRSADGTRELDEVVANLQSYYQCHTSDYGAHLSRGPVTGGEDSLWYIVLNGSEVRIGQVKITPKGVVTKTDSRPEDDFPISDPNRYKETYWVYFFPDDKSMKREQREGFASFVDSTRIRTRRNVARR